MIIAELPVDEELRLADLASYDIMESIEEDDFNDLVELAAQICKCPISLISLLDKDRQWFKAKKGIADSSTPKDIAFCSHAILGNKVMEVSDTTKDERFFDNPFVTGDPNVRFYAGAPIVSAAGHKLGTICIIDTHPRKLLPEEERALIILSHQVTKLLELRKKNMLIRQRAEEMIAMKSKVINNMIQQEEAGKKAISYQLHEGLAQSMASGLMFLNMELLNKETIPPHIQTARKQFNEVLTGIKNLSYDITPPTVAWISAEELVKEFIEKVTGTFPYQLKLKIDSKKSSYGGSKTIVIIRIIEQWLKALANKENVTGVGITIQTNDNFELLIEDNSPVLGFALMRKEIFESVVFDMAQSIGASIDLSVSSLSKNSFRLILPLGSAELSLN